MKKISSLALSLMFVCNVAFADNCDWSTIKEIDGPEFVYSPECHNQVGKLVANEKDYKIQIDSQKKVIQLKDLTIKDLTANSNMWEKEAHSQFKALENYRSAEKTRTWLWFGGGVGATILAIVIAGQVSK